MQGWGSVGRQACPQQPCKGAESRGRRGPVCPLHQRIWKNTVCIWVYIKFLGTAKLQTWIQGLGLNAATDSFWKNHQEQACKNLWVPTGAHRSTHRGTCMEERTFHRFPC